MGSYNALSDIVYTQIKTEDIEANKQILPASKYTDLNDKGHNLRYPSAEPMAQKFSHTDIEFNALLLLLLDDSVVVHFFERFLSHSG